MAQLLNREALTQQADLHADAPVVTHQTQVDRTFELPAGLYVTTVGCFVGFLAVMAIGFATPALAIPLAVMAFLVIAGFVVPTIWTRLAPDNAKSPKSWARFAREGVMTGSGRATARDASVQVLILPILIFFWGVISVVIAALV